MRLTSPLIFLNRSLIAVFTIFVFACTFSVSAGSIAGGVAAILFFIATIVAHRNPFQGDLRWFYATTGLFILWMLVTVQKVDPGLGSLAELRHEWLFVLVPVGIFLFQNDKRARQLVAALTLGVGLISIYSIGQFFWGWNFLKPHYQIEKHALGYWIIGNFDSSVTFGIFYAVAGLFLLAYGLGVQKSESTCFSRLAVLTGGIAIVAAVLSNERGPTVAVILSILVLAVIVRSKRTLIGGVICLVMIGVAGLQSGVFVRSATLMEKELSYLHDQGRLFIWTHAFYVARDNPFFGVGPGHFREGFAAELPTDPPGFVPQGHAHNDFLTYAAESGFPQLILFLGLWIVVWGYSWRAYRSLHGSPDDRRVALAALAGSTCFFFTSFFDIPFAHSATRQMLMFVWAAGLGIYLKLHLADSEGSSRTA